MADPLHDRWDSLCHRVGAAGLTGEMDMAYEMIVTMYANPPRAYHNLDHIGDCLTFYDGVRMLAGDRDEIEFALWMHDSIYFPMRSDNETRSIDAAGMVAALLGCPPAFVGRVRELIAVTQHDEPPFDADSGIMADVDLSVLGGTEEAYERYRLSIRAEFGEVRDELFNEGRRAFLERMLDREYIYSTLFVREAIEDRARENLERELGRFR